MKTTIILTLAGILLLAGCQKHDGLFDGNATIEGIVYLHDTLDTGLPVILPNQKVYLNTTPDTNSFLYTTTSNEEGWFSIKYLHTGRYYLMVKTNKESLNYRGLTQQIALEAEDQEARIDIYAFPEVTNGISLAVKDSLGGNLSHFPFKIYLSEVAALTGDSAYLFTKGTTNANGIFKLCNIPATTYFIVAMDTLGGEAVEGRVAVTLSARGVLEIDLTVR